MTSKEIITIVLNIIVLLTLMILYINDKIVKYKRIKKAKNRKIIEEWLDEEQH